MKRYHQRGQLDGKWIQRYCHGDWRLCVRWQMEERGQYHPDRMLPDGTLDERLRQGLRPKAALSWAFEPVRGAIYIF